MNIQELASAKKRMFNVFEQSIHNDCSLENIVYRLKGDMLMKAMANIYNQSVRRFRMKDGVDEVDGYRLYRMINDRFWEIKHRGWCIVKFGVYGYDFPFKIIPVSGRYNTDPYPCNGVYLDEIGVELSRGNVKSSCIPWCFDSVGMLYRQETNTNIAENKKLLEFAKSEQDSADEHRKAMASIVLMSNPEYRNEFIDRECRQILLSADYLNRMCWYDIDLYQKLIKMYMDKRAMEEMSYEDKKRLSEDYLRYGLDYGELFSLPLSSIMSYERKMMIELGVINYHCLIEYGVRGRNWNNPVIDLTFNLKADADKRMQSIVLDDIFTILYQIAK